MNPDDVECSKATAFSSKAFNMEKFLKLLGQESCSGCVKVENSNIRDHPEVLAFAKKIPFGPITLCNLTLKEADPYTHYTLPNGDSKFQFDATFDIHCSHFFYEATVTCRNFEILQSGNEKQKLKALNEKNVDCSKPELKPGQEGKTF